MKKALFTLVALALASSAFAQGQLTSLSNFEIPLAGGGTYNASIKDGSKSGTPDAAAGTYTAGIFGPDGSLLGSGALLIDGYFLIDGTVTVPNAPVGSPAQITVKAWETGKTYETSTIRGSTTFTSLALGGTVAGNPPVTAPGMTGLQGFSVAPVPEPGTIALGALGVGALLLRRRK